MAKVPLPGKPMRGSESGRPIMAAMNIFSRRWVLRIIWELRDGACGFRELQARCEKMSPDTLSTRLNELKTAGIVVNDAQNQWQLSELGYALKPALTELNRWSKLWDLTLNTSQRTER